MTVAITEKQFSKQVEYLFKLFRWEYSHTYEQTHYARRSTKGFPDYVAVRPPRLLFIELKSEEGIVSPEQEKWLDLLNQVSEGSEVYPDGLYSGAIIEVYLWRPSDMEPEGGKIAEILR